MSLVVKQHKNSITIKPGEVLEKAPINKADNKKVVALRQLQYDKTMEHPSTTALSQDALNEQPQKTNGAEGQAFAAKNTLKNDKLKSLAILAGVAAGSLMALSAVVYPTLSLALAGLSVGTVATALFLHQRRPRITHHVWQTIMTSLPEPALIVANDLTVLLHNKRAEDEFEGLAEGKNLNAAFRGDILTYVEKVVRTGAPHTQELTERGHVERFFEVHITKLDAHLINEAWRERDPVFVYFRDLTKHRRVEQMRVDFVANVSHELRTPLAALSGFVETLQGPARNDPKAQGRFLEIMQGQTDRMRRLIDDLLSLSRIEVNAHIKPTEETSLSLVVEEAVQSLQNLAEKNGIALTLDAPEQAVVMLGERDELVRLLENLIQNAIRYGGGGGRVDVTLKTERRADDIVEGVLAVRDYGAGIAPEHLPRLTERFYRADKNESRAKGGTGLGLAIVKHIINRHRGRMQIESRLGEGTCFAVRFPLVSGQSIPKNES